MNQSEYEIKLTPQEQRMALVDLAKGLQRNIAAVAKKRSWRLSEKAMTTATFKRQHVAVLMAIDDIDGMVIDKKAFTE